MNAIPRYAVFAAAFIMLGCRQMGPAPVTVDPYPANPRVDYSDLAIVLNRAVDEGGFLRSYEVADVQDRLDRQLALLAITGPTATPELFADADADIAYWYNARAAWAIKLSAMRGCSPSPSTSSFEHIRFRLDGRMMTLRLIDDELAGFDDWRIVAAAPCVRLRRSALAREPFDPATVREAAVERFNDYAADSDRFVIDVEHRQVPYNHAIWRFRDRIIAEYERSYGTRGVSLNTALLPHISGLGQGRLQAAVGYKPVPADDAGPLACAYSPVE